MSPRIDSASQLVAASPERVYRAFAVSGAMERWLPPDGMTGEMVAFDGAFWRITHDGVVHPVGPDAHAVKVGAIPASWSVPGVEIYRLRRPR